MEMEGVGDILRIESAAASSDGVELSDAAMGTAEEALLGAPPRDEGPKRWRSSSDWKRDVLHFVGPGWLVCIAYVDPGNYQANVLAGATSRYALLWTFWWSTMLSLYVQHLCCRLAYYGQVTLAEVQARDPSRGRWLRYLDWAIAEFSVVITDLPEVIGIGIAFNIMFGWPYYVGVLLSLVTTFVFLATLSRGMRFLEYILVCFVSVMSVVLFAEMGVVGVDGDALMRGWVYGFVEAEQSDLFTILSIIGAVVMPHNLYLHTASLQSRPVERNESTVKKAVRYSSWEPALPTTVSFFVNMAMLSIAAEEVYGKDNADQVGLTDLCSFLSTRAGCILFAVALLSAGQSSAITTTFTGQYIMDGFLDIRLPTYARALMTRAVAIVPCVAFAVAYPDGVALNRVINDVNGLLSILLPFALTPLVKYNASAAYMGEHAAGRWESRLLYLLGFAVYLINAVALSCPGGGWFGDAIAGTEPGGRRAGWIVLSVLCQAFYLGWNVHCVASPVGARMTPLEERRPWKKDEFATVGASA